MTQRTDPTGQTRSGPDERVWDLPVRLFHWSLVACVLTALATGWLAPPDWIDAHVAAGSAILALLVMRVIWGFTGTYFSRFASFPLSLPAGLRYLTGLLERHASPHSGHNPAGAMMVYALLAVLGLLTVSGVLAEGGANKEGPLAFVLSFATGQLGRTLHGWLAWSLVVLIVFHVLGVVVSSLVERRNLARAMLTGRKCSAGAVSHAPIDARPVSALALSLAAAGLVVPTVVLLNRLPALGVPRAALDRAYVSACGECHEAYHPSLLPRASWHAIVTGLGDHFGEDSRLDTALLPKIERYLDGNAAEAFDTKAANRMRAAASADPTRITASPGWQRSHRRIADSIFARATIGARARCSACHHDAATGRFDRRRIAIP